MRSSFYLFGLGSVLGLMGTLGGCTSPTQSVQVASKARHLSDQLQTKMPPDLNTRQLAEKIRGETVSHLFFHGPRTFDEGFIVTDPVMIEQFLQALRHAYTSADAPAGNLVDTLEIHFKPIGNTRPKPEILRFCAASREDYFGPEFRAALTTLGNYQAAQVRQFVQQERNNIRSIQVSPDRHLTQAAEMDSFLGDLEKVQGNALLYNGTGNTTWPILIRLQTGGEKQIIFRFSLPTNPGETLPDPPLPPELWKHYLAFLQGNGEVLTYR